MLLPTCFGIYRPSSRRSLAKEYNYNKSFTKEYNYNKLYSSVNDLPEDGLWRSKHVGATENNKWLLMVTCAMCWIKYCITEINFSTNTVCSQYQAKMNTILQIIVAVKNMHFTSIW
jgi:hypothetical protein